MTAEAEAKNWYLHLEGQPRGPLTFELMMSEYRAGRLTRETHVWCDGMAGWTLARDVAELNSIFSPTAASAAPPARSAPPAAARSSRSAASSPPDSTHLVELNPREVDDRTHVLDPDKLKEAIKAATVAQKVEAKAEKKAVAAGIAVVAPSRGGKRKLLLALVGLPLIAAVAIGGAVALKLTTVDQLKANAGRMFQGLTSPLGSLDDVSPDQLELLRAAAGANLKDGPQAAIAASTQNPDKPTIYVASNLPDGTNLSFQLKAEPGAVLSEGPVELRFPLAIAKHLARSRSLHGPDGGALAPGEYVATVVATDEQTPDVQALLKKTPLAPVTRKLFLGGVKDAAFGAKLEEVRKKRLEKGVAEQKLGTLTASQLEHQLTAVWRATDRLSKITDKAGLLKAWQEFGPPWAAANPEPLEKGTVYPEFFSALHDLWGDETKIHELQGGVATGSADAAKTWPQVTALYAQAYRKLTAVKSKLAEIAKETGQSL
jgi:hypothetical protein